MKQGFVAFALFVFMVLSAGVFAGVSASPNRILGLVEVPGIFGERALNGPPGQVEPKQIKPVELRGEPKTGAKVVATITNGDDLTSRELAYEEKSAVVYGESAGWFFIESKRGRGWLAPKDAGAFHRYPDLVEKESSYLEKAHWDGRIYAAPGDKKPIQREAGADDENEIRVLAKKSVGDRLWFRIQFVTGRCEGEEKAGSSAWVPAYNDRGEANVWFHARGC